MNKAFISKNDSRYLYGIAILLMIYHHMFGFPDRIHVAWSGLFNYGNYPIEVMLAPLGRICIAIYAFVSGYGMMKKSFLWKLKDTISKGYFLTIKQLWKFYSRYWVVLLLFLPYGFLKGIFDFNITELFKNVIGISCSYNAEWWYVYQYMRMLLCFPVIAVAIKAIANISGRLVRSVCEIILLLVIIILGFVLQKAGFFIYLICFIEGMLCTLPDVEMVNGRFDNLSKWIKVAIWFVIFIIIVGLKLSVFMLSSYDFVIIIPSIWCICTFLHLHWIEKYVGKVLIILGNYSIYMWLIHTFFINYYFQKLSFITGKSIIDYIWSVLLILLVAAVVEKVYKVLCKIISHITYGAEK